MSLKEDVYKKLYETVLSSKEQTKQVYNALHNILRLSFEDSFHFSFLLNRVPWFENPFINFLDVLQKAIRLYRARGKQAIKVGYNILVQGLSNPLAYKPALECIFRLTQGQWNIQILLKCLQENYPHKVCSTNIHLTYLQSLIQLGKQFINDRQQILEIVVQNLVLMDTQLLEGDQLIDQPFPPDMKMKEVVTTELSTKYDTLLTCLIKYLDDIKMQPTILTEMLLIFQKKILMADRTKLIQFILFYLAQTDKKSANKFSSFLLGNILSLYSQTTNKAFINSTFYLSSYLARSTRLSFNHINKITQKLIQFLIVDLNNIPQSVITNKTDLNKLYSENLKFLYLLQIILLTICYHPTIKVLQGQKLNYLLKMATSKTHYQMFIHPDIINIIEGESKSKNILIKIENKFNPPLSGQICQYIQPIIRCTFKNSSSTKKVKIGLDNSTPISVVSCQQSTYKY